MKIKRLTEEIGFKYGKQEEAEVAAAMADAEKKAKKKKSNLAKMLNMWLNMLFPILQTVAKDAYEAGKSGESFDDWFMKYVEEEKTLKKARTKIGF